MYISKNLGMHLSLRRKLIYPFIFLFLAISWFEISFSKKLNSETLDSEDINTFIQKALDLEKNIDKDLKNFKNKLCS